MGRSRRPRPGGFNFGGRERIPQCCNLFNKYACAGRHSDNDAAAERDEHDNSYSRIFGDAHGDRCPKFHRISHGDRWPIFHRIRHGHRNTRPFCNAEPSVQQDANCYPVCMAEFYVYINGYIDSHSESCVLRDIVSKPYDDPDGVANSNSDIDIDIHTNDHS